jgi:hypothetical protein
VKKIPRYKSDHNPLVYGSDLENKVVSRAFCFETSWLKHPSFTTKIRDIWGKDIKAKSIVDNDYKSSD